MEKLLYGESFILFQERLDFSCALFDPDGGLVSNAPHIPVHLGAMQEAVQYQVSFILFYSLLRISMPILFLIENFATVLVDSSWKGKCFF